MASYRQVIRSELIKGTNNNMKLIFIIILACISIWQGFLIYFLTEVNDVIEGFGAEPGGNMLMFLSLAQPILWALLASTLLAIYDLYHRDVVLITNSVAIALIAFFATASCHVLTLLVGYGPIFELGNGQ